MLNISSRQPRACPLSVPSGPSASLDDERPLTIRPMRAPGGNYNDLIVRPNDSPRRRPRRRVPSSLGASPIASRLRAATSSVDESLSYRLRRTDGSARPRGRRCRDRPRARFVGQMRGPVLHPGDLRLGSVGLFQSAFDGVLPLRLRSSASGPRRRRGTLTSVIFATVVMCDLTLEDSVKW